MQLTSKPHWHTFAIPAFSAVLLIGVPVNGSAETAAQPNTIERARKATVGILEDTQDPRVPDKPGKIKIRGTGFHLRDGYIVTARHAVEKNSPTGHIVPKIIHVLTSDLHELVAQIVGDSAYLDVVLYRLNQKDRSILDVGTAFAAEPPAVGSEVFSVCTRSSKRTRRKHTSTAVRWPLPFLARWFPASLWPP